MSTQDDPVAAWAASGAMCLTGRTDSRPLLAPGDPAGLVRRQIAELESASLARTGVSLSSRAAVPDSRLLGERAAIAGLERRGPVSVGGSFRALRTVDGWLGLSLARADDVALLPALVEAAADDPWTSVASWARRGTTGEAYARALLLGLPAAAWPPEPTGRPAVRTTTGGRRARPERPVVVDLTSLWAGPLCAHLLGLAGAQVVKVESSHRLDGSRRGTPAFYDLLHAGHDSVTLDFTDPADRGRLEDLLGRADLVLESSRSRALEALGIMAASYVAQGVSWLSITARGRDSDAVGFGDDVAVAAGLAVVEGDDLLPVGDAIADPLTGAAAAAAAAAALLAERASLIDVSMLDVVRDAVGPTPEGIVTGLDGVWWVETSTGRHRVAVPVARRAGARAAAPGQHNEVWLR